jgi:hypothetical protein
VRSPGSGDCPKRFRTYITHQVNGGITRGLTQRPVAIRALGWRLRVELRLTGRFEVILRSGHTTDFIRQSPLPETLDRQLQTVNR